MHAIGTKKNLSRDPGEAVGVGGHDHPGSGEGPQGTGPHKTGAGDDPRTSGDDGMSRGDSEMGSGPGPEGDGDDGVGAGNDRLDSVCRAREAVSEARDGGSGGERVHVGSDVRRLFCQDLNHKCGTIALLYNSLGSFVFSS